MFAAFSGYKTFIGIAIAAAAQIAKAFGYDEGTVDSLANLSQSLITDGLTWFGLIFAAYGRAVAKA